MPSKKKLLSPIRKTPVTRTFLLNLANEIYDTKSRKFLRLCDGTLQNGPDPTDEDRSMHCGLGELYFAMTGHQPKDDHVNGSDVVDLAVERSPLYTADGALVAKATLAIKALKLPGHLEDTLIDAVQNNDELTNEEDKFRLILAGIPDDNDQGPGSFEVGTCTYETYRSRSSRVAASLRAAAKLLPA